MTIMAADNSVRHPLPVVFPTYAACETQEAKVMQEIRPANEYVTEVSCRLAEQP